MSQNQVLIRTHDRNKSELLKALVESATFGQGAVEVKRDGRIEHRPRVVWLDEAPPAPSPALFNTLAARGRLLDDIYRAWGVPNLG